MCGIVGYIGSGNQKDILYNGLKELEYRGYDSAGMAIMHKKDIKAYKAAGKLENLKAKLANFTCAGAKGEFGVGIAHTRWATHGKPTEINAHPHTGKYSYVIQNGIIENFAKIKNELIDKGVEFLSQTDTEVIVHLFESFIDMGYEAFEAFEATVNRLEGSYAVLLISKSCEDTIFFAKQNAPLILGKNKNGEKFFASSDAPIVGLASEVHYLEDGTYGFMNKNAIYTKIKENDFEADFKPLTISKSSAQKDGFRYFMEKEIYEQSIIIGDTLSGRIDENGANFDDELQGINIDDFDSVEFCACGTSYHAALSMAYSMERIAKIKTSVQIASEFRYKDPIIDPKTLFIVISQSGETADTLEALKIAKKAGAQTLAICNVGNSTIVRTAHHTLLTRAGIEKGVASTKAFATQTMTLWLLVLYFAQKKNTISQDELKSELEAIRKIPQILKVKSTLHQKIHRLSKRYLHGHGFFFIGRDLFYPLALEGALKLKEISYLHAEGYASGEMKHGPIALADSELFTIALMPKNILYDKTKSNVEELSARDATILAISPLDFELSDDFIRTGEHDHYMCEFFEMMVVVQLLALEISVRLGTDVDMPRNLAKSVTVE